MKAPFLAMSAQNTINIDIREVWCMVHTTKRADQSVRAFHYLHQSISKTFCEKEADKVKTSRHAPSSIVTRTLQAWPERALEDQAQRISLTSPFLHQRANLDLISTRHKAMLDFVREAIHPLNRRHLRFSLGAFKCLQSRRKYRDREL